MKRKGKPIRNANAAAATSLDDDSSCQVPIHGASSNGDGGDLGDRDVTATAQQPRDDAVHTDTETLHDSWFTPEGAPAADAGSAASNDAVAVTPKRPRRRRSAANAKHRSFVGFSPNSGDSFQSGLQSYGHVLRLHQYDTGSNVRAVC